MPRFFFVCRSRPNWRRRRPKRESNSTSEWESLAVNFVFFFISFSIASTSVAGASLLTVRRRRCSGENRAAVAMATRRARYIDSRRRFSRARRRRARGKMFVEKKINKSNTSNCALMIFFSRLWPDPPHVGVPRNCTPRTGFYWVLLCFTGFYCVLLFFTRFYWVLFVFTGFYCVLLGVTGFYWVLLRFTAFSLVLIGFHWF